MNKWIITVCTLAMVASTTVSAQVQFNGTMDVSISSGGEDSEFISNGISQDYKYLHFSIPQVNLLMFAPINESFFVEARLQSDTWGTGKLRTPRFTLANITWSDPDRDYSISAGRFISPVGFYNKRNLNIDRVFVDLPLYYSYFVNVSDERGFWPNAGAQSNYISNDVGLTNIYFGGYATGVLFDWSIIENKLRLETALTSVAPASDQDYTNLANAAGLLHLSYNPNIYWKLGLSASHGSYMQESSVNSIYRNNSPFEQYRQTLVGVDVTYGLAYVEIVAEGMFTHWTAPCYRNGIFNLYGDELAKYYLTNAGFNVDFKYEPPFFTGSYVGLRFDHLNFLTAKTSRTTMDEDWDEDLSRVSAVVGYKLSRNIVLKVAVSDQTPFDQSLYTFRTYLTAFF